MRDQMRPDDYIDIDDVLPEVSAKEQFAHELALEDEFDNPPIEVPAPTRSVDRPWEESATALDLFIQSNKRLPSRGADRNYDEYRLAVWLMNVRLQTNLTATQQKRLARWERLR